MNKSVICITVTYNRSNTLEKTLYSLLNQSYKSLEKIIVVDNGSNSIHLEKIKNMEKSSDKIKVLYLDKNLGGAGGFFKGMEYALKNYNSDWLWIMDDDAYPTRECLEMLMKHSDTLENIGCLAPAIYGIDKKQYQMYHHKKISPLKIKEITINSEYNNLDYITKIDANAFVGPLFLRKAVENVGLPDSELFIYGDDTEYTYRVSRKFELYLIKNAIIEHQDVLTQENTLKPEAWWKEYYMYRNKFLFVSKFETNLLKKYLSNIIMINRILKKVIGALIKLEYKNFRMIRIKMLLKSIRDGIVGKKGKIIDPKEYTELISGLKD